jgi:hypothetical protein
VLLHSAFTWVLHSMPNLKLSDPDRRRLTLAALSGVSPSKLAEEYGVSRSHVYKLKQEARDRAEAEGEFWDSVRKLAIILVSVILVSGAFVSGCSSTSAELTANDLSSLNDQERAVFLLCQSDKYIADHGKKEWEAFLFKHDSPATLEKALLERDYSCTMDEVHDYL